MSKTQLILAIIQAALVGVAAVPGGQLASGVGLAFTQILQNGLQVYQQETGQPLDLSKIPLRFGTRWWPSHIEFFKDSGFHAGCLGSRVSGGVRIRPYYYCNPTREEWWTAPKIEDAYAIALKDIGCKYDWLDIFGFAFARDWHHPGRYICSELVDWAFKQAGAPLTNIYMPSHRVSPRDLLVSPQLEFVRKAIG